MTSFPRAALAVLALAAAGLPAPAPAQERPATILVLDASGSMWGQIDGVNKITIAREVVAGILSDFPAGQNLGLVTYGHRERGQCADIELVVPPAPGTAALIAETVNGLNPRGMTPMTDAVILAAEALRHTEQAATVILVSDGIETCNPDPCAAARALEEAGIDFTAHVVGFDVSGEAEALMQMQCIAEATGGRFLTADNARELTEALQEVVAVPATAAVTMIAVMDRPDGEQVETPVTWGFARDGERLEINGNPGILDLPPGNWQVTGYHTVLEREQEAQLEVVAGQAQTRVMVFEAPQHQAALKTPAQAAVGAEFPVGWQAEGLNPRDYVTIVPAGAEAGSYGDYTRIGDASEGKLRAPAEPGLYEVRLQMEGSGRVLASAPIEIVDVPVAVSVPAQATVGAEFPVGWQAEGLNPRDYVTIVAEGAEPGSYGDYTRIGDASEGKLRAPAEPGLYEVRLQMEGSGRVLASAPIEVVEGAVTVSGPDRLRAGTEMVVTWTGAIHPRDYVTIVPAGADDGDYADYIRVGTADSGKLRSPQEPGLYELRYRLEGGSRVMARHPVEVLAADAPMDAGAGLVVPASAKPGEAITVTWSGGADEGDQRVTLARADQADFSWISAETALGRDSLEVTMPDVPGRYEIRFLDIGNRQVLGRSIVEVQP
ncbi:MAG TPA: VWA domain-containing protein [Paracoccus solventivorans]|uniref:VWA domain-containing protein n=1 Tax=Paracoccus solventivorans TaxID=53463 RepID=A0A832PNW4_9RHOB|nr:VWA domain-containing protein [Paracoccus solventivorans]HHW35198.1 VWA domain-containing protein [Paracoccus solventivorans]